MPDGRETFRSAFEREVEEAIRDDLARMSPEQRVTSAAVMVLTLRVYDKHYDSKGNPKNV